MAGTVAASVVQSRLDYTNALLHGTLAGNIQYSVLRTPCLMLRCLSRLSHLHWLPVHRRIQYKITLVTYKSLSTNQPPYLRNLLHMYQPSRCLRSASQNLLSIPFCTTNFSECSFSFSAPTIWNELPAVIKESNTLDTFKRCPKTHLTSLTIPVTCNHLSRPAPEIHCVSKKTAKLFLSELCQMSTNCENFWHKDGEEDNFT